jgi:hypothetical protein
MLTFAADNFKNPHIESICSDQQVPLKDPSIIQSHYRSVSSDVNVDDIAPRVYLGSFQSSSFQSTMEICSMDEVVFLLRSDQSSRHRMGTHSLPEPADVGELLGMLGGSIMIISAHLLLSGLVVTNI